MFLSARKAEDRYNQWVRDHYRFLMRSAWAITGSRSVAEDVVQDCYTLAWKNRTQLREDTLARAWLFRIMRRCAMRQHSPSTEQLEINDDGDWSHDRAADDPQREDRMDVVKALSRIAPIHREVLVLFYFDDMPTAQMAEALDIAPGTVLSRLSRAREALKAVLRPRPLSNATIMPLRKTGHG